MDTLLQLQRRGVVLWLRDGELRYKAPRGSLTEADILRLKESRAQLAQLLKTEGVLSDEVEPPLRPRQVNGPAPLTYAQLAHWRRYQLETRRSVRQIPSVTRLSGQLNLAAVEKGIAEIVRRHEALRTRIVLRNGIPHQELCESSIELRVDDMTRVSMSMREAAVQRAVEEVILEPVDVTVGPLFDARVLKLTEDEHVLILATEHLASDGHSQGILLREVLASYAASVDGCPAALPPISIQLADYAVWQRACESTWTVKHRAYWKERLHGCRRLRFPEDKALGGLVRPGWGNVSVCIERELKSLLIQWCRMNRTTLALSVFTAYAAAVLQWCGVTDGMLRYEINGRIRPEIENTVGYFASGLNLRIQVDRNQTLEDIARRVVQEYCAAYEHADSALLDTELPLHECLRSSAFNWLPEAGAPLPALASLHDKAIRLTQLSFPHPLMRTYEWDAEPAIVLFDTTDDVAAFMYFPMSRFSPEYMMRFAECFIAYVEALATRPRARMCDVGLRR